MTPKEGTEEKTPVSGESDEEDAFARNTLPGAIHEVKEEAEPTTEAAEDEGPDEKSEATAE